MLSILSNALRVCGLLVLACLYMSYSHAAEVQLNDELDRRLHLVTEAEKQRFPDPYSKSVGKSSVNKLSRCIGQSELAVNLLKLSKHDNGALKDVQEVLSKHRVTFEEPIPKASTTKAYTLTDRAAKWYSNQVDIAVQRKRLGHMSRATGVAVAVGLITAGSSYWFLPAVPIGIGTASYMLSDKDLDRIVFFSGRFFNSKKRVVIATTTVIKSAENLPLTRFTLSLMVDPEASSDTILRVGECYITPKKIN